MSPDPRTHQPRPWPVTAWASLLVVVALVGCGSGGDGVAGEGAGSGGSDSATVGAGLTTITGANGAQVVVADGAFATPTTIRIARDSTGAPTLPSLFSSAGATYSATPSGLLLGQTVLVRIPIDPTTPAETPVALAQAEAGGNWQLYLGARRSGNLLEADVRSLGFFQVVRLQPAVTAQAQAQAKAKAKSQGNASGVLAQATATPVVALGLRVSTSDRSFVSGSVLEQNVPGILERAVPFAAPALVPFVVESFGNAGFTSFCTNAASIRVRQTNPDVGVVFGTPYNHVFEESVLLDPSARASPWRFDLRAHRPFGATSTDMNATVGVECLDPVSPARYVVWSDQRIRYHVVDPTTLGFLERPADVSALPGQAATFSVHVLGGALVPNDRDQYRFEWQRSDDGGTVWSPLGVSYQSDRSDFSNDTGTPQALTLARVSSADNGARIRARVCYAKPGGAEQCVIGESALLTVPQSSMAPTIARQPRSQQVRVGETASFSVEVTGTPAPTLRWQMLPPAAAAWVDVGSSTASWPGAAPRAATLVTAPAALADDGSLFRVVVENGAGVVVSDTVRWRVSEALVAPTIVLQPQSANAAPGATAVFAVTAEGTSPFSYDWYHDGVAVAGANGNALLVADVGAASLGAYRVVVTGPGGNVTSRDATLSLAAGVAPVGTAPAIVTQPLPQTVALGQAATFATVVAGTPAPQCRWTRNGITIAGATSCASYTTPLAQAGDNGAVFNVFATNSAGAAIGGGAVLTVQGNTPPAGPWTILESRSGSFIADIALVGGDPDIAVAVGFDATVLRTTDGGTTWTAIAVPLPVQRSLQSVRFRDRLVGVAVGLFDILRTTDGGLSWQSVWTSDGVNGLRAFDWLDATTLVAAGSGRVWRSTDAGLTWSMFGAGSLDSVQSVRFLNPLVGLANAYFAMYRTADGGLTWSEVSAGVFTDGAASVDCGSATSCISVGGLGRYRSTDAGLTWVREAQPIYLSAVRARGAELMVVGDRGLVQRSTDGGATWSSGPSLPFGLLAGADLVPGGRAFVVGAGGLVARRN